MDFLTIIIGATAERCLQVFAVTVALLALELAIPAQPVPIVSRLRGAVFWLITIPATAFCLTTFHYFVWRSGLTPLVRLSIGEWFHAHSRPVALVGLVAAPVLSGAISDFFGYWYHRAQHAIPLLWRIHCVHHSIQHLSAVNSNHHWTEEVFRVPLMSFPAALLIGPDPGVVLPIVAGLLVAQGAFIHASTRFHLGPLRWVFVDNRFHRIHHSLEERHFGKNYAAFTPLWDRIFGTVYHPAPEEWPDTGLAELAEPDDFTEWFGLPWRYNRLTASRRAGLVRVRDVEIPS